MQVVGGFRTPADWRPRLLSSRNNPWSRRLTSAGSPETPATDVCRLASRDGRFRGRLSTVAPRCCGTPVDRRDFATGTGRASVFPLAPQEWPL